MRENKWLRVSKPPARGGASSSWNKGSSVMEERPELTDLLEIWCVGGGSGAGDPVSLSIRK